LQSLAGFLELGLARERSPEEYRTVLREAQTQSNDLIVLAKALLTLNQVDTATLQPPHSEVDIADIAERTLHNLQAPIAERGLNAEINTCGAAPLSAPGGYMEILIRNLLENAVKYARAGGTIRVLCAADSLEVHNDCDPIDGWDDVRIFEPFFRPDASRTSQTGGNGLGLAICAAICRSSGWQLALHQVTGGVRARVSFSSLQTSLITTALPVSRR
jgi:signal transduction histidine kinase